MPNIDDAMLEAAHRHSYRNRALISAGGVCGCFYCRRTFDASRVQQFVDDGQTALCPYCGVDAVLSATVDPIDANFLRQMHRRFFEHQAKAHS